MIQLDVIGSINDAIRCDWFDQCLLSQFHQDYMSNNLIAFHFNPRFKSINEQFVLQIANYFIHYLSLLEHIILSSSINDSVNCDQFDQCLQLQFRQDYTSNNNFIPFYFSSCFKSIDG